MQDRRGRHLDRKIDHFANRLSAWAGDFVRWLSSPSSRLVRIPIALALFAGGFVGFLPILGFWMIPLGSLLLAQDVPPIRLPVLGFLSWVERRWKAWKRR